MKGQIQFYYIIFLLLFHIGHTWAQGSIQYQWGAGLIGSDYDFSQSLIVDGDGNAYLVGQYRDSLDLDFGAGSDVITGNGLFWAKYTNTGDYEFGMGIENGLLDFGRNIALDKDGAIWVAGSFRNRVDLDAGGSAPLILANGYKDVFVAKYDSLGDYVSGFIFGGSNGSGSCSVQKITVDDQGNIYLVGWFDGTIDFDPDTSGVQLFSSTGVASSSFLAKYTSAGQLVYAKPILSNIGVAGHGMEVDSNGNVMVAGVFSGVVDFDPGSGTQQFTSMSITGSDLFVARYNLQGNLQWVHTIGAPDAGFKVRNTTLDKDGSIYITGAMGGTVDFDPGPGVAIDSSLSTSVYVLSFDSSGLFKREMVINDGYDDNSLGYGIDIDDNYNTYLAGYFGDTLDFDPGPGTASLYGDGSNAGYVAIYDSVGNYINAIAIYGSIVRGLAVDGNEDVLVVGFYAGATDFDGGPGQATLPAIGIDAFLAKYSINDIGVINASTNATCNGLFDGSVLLSASNGVPPYTYAIPALGVISNAGMFDSLRSGQYSYAVTDSLGEVSRGVFSIGENDTIVPVPQIFDETCWGAIDGRVEFSVLGGAAPFTYSVWGVDTNSIGVFDSLYADTYIYEVVDSLGCMADGSLTVMPGNNIHISGLSLTDVKCFGDNSGAVNFNVTADTAVTFMWSNGDITQDLANVEAGEYMVTITDAIGCITARTYELQQPDSLSLQHQVQDIACFGDSNGSVIVSTVGGVLPYQYMWSSGASTDTLNDLFAGLYTLTFTDGNGCTLTDTVDLLQGDLIDTVTFTSTIVNDTIVLSVTDTFDAYQWFKNGSTIINETGPSLRVPWSGNYSVTATLGDCTQSSVSQYFTALGINQALIAAQISTHPNPTTGRLHINWGQDLSEVQISVLNIQGKQVFNQTVENVASLNIDLSPFSEGIYLVQITTQQGSVVRRVVKQ